MPSVKVKGLVHPFGMMMPGREYQAQPSRFGFNGKENDNDVKGFGNQQDYGMRIYDNRIGKFLSVDPLQKQFAWLAPYGFAGNNPIKFIDLDGKEPLDYSWKWIWSTERPTKWNYSVANVYDKWTERVWTVMQRPNDNRIYYWKPYDGSNQIFDAKNSKQGNGTWNGRWVQFERQETIQARFGKNLADGLSLFFAAGIVASVASPAIASGTGLLVSYGEFLTIQIGARVGPFVPIASQYGRKVLEFLDETGMAPSSGFSRLEKNIIAEAKSILNSKEMNVLKDACERAIPAEVTINGRKVLFEPNLPGSGFTLHGENAFMLGSEAFKRSPDELGKTILHELYRLFTQSTGELSIETAKPFTKSAEQFADEAYKELKK